MRYYKITIRDPSGVLVQTASSVPGTNATYTSYANNQSLPGALQIELDIPIGTYAQPLGGALVKIWGISQKEISSATQWNPRNVNGELSAFSVEIEAGFQKGLPLANPKQRGLILSGIIFQSFGNWLDTEMSIDLIIQPNFGTTQSPKNISFKWPALTKLEDAITASMTNAGFKAPIININPNVVLNNTEDSYYTTLSQFAVYLNKLSISIIGGDSYPGIDIFLRDNVLRVNDQSTAQTPMMIQFQDLIGQPTWIEGSTIQFKCPIRADIAMGDWVKLPPAIVTSVASPTAALTNQQATFQGTFFISQLRHVGNFRQADAASWVTTFDARTTPVPST